MVTLLYNEPVEEPNDLIGAIIILGAESSTSSARIRIFSCWEMLWRFHTIHQKLRWWELSRPVYIVKPTF